MVRGLSLGEISRASERIPHHPDKGCELMTVENVRQLEAELEELALILQEGFKFLDSTGLSSQHKVMFSIGHCLKVYRTIILVDPIQVMNNPAFRERLAVGDLPYKDLFQDIALARSSRMVPFKNTYISAGIFTSASLPIFVVLSRLEDGREHFARSPTLFHGARQATAFTSGVTVNDLSAIMTEPWRLLSSEEYPHLGLCALLAPSSVIGTRITTVNAGVLMGLIPSSCGGKSSIIKHTGVIADVQLDVNTLATKMQSKCLECPLPQCRYDKVEEGQWRKRPKGIHNRRRRG